MAITVRAWNTRSYPNQLRAQPWLWASSGSPCSGDAAEPVGLLTRPNALKDSVAVSGAPKDAEARTDRDTKGYQAGDDHAFQKPKPRGGDHCIQSFVERGEGQNRNDEIVD